jgi:hypothetical protein
VPKVLTFGEYQQCPEDGAFLRWCEKHPDGFVANVKIPEQSVCVHAASCAWGQAASWGSPTWTNVKLVCVDQLTLLRVLKARYPDLPVVHCGHCFWDE